MWKAETQPNQEKWDREETKAIPRAGNTLTHQPKKQNKRKQKQKPPKPDTPEPRQDAMRQTPENKKKFQKNTFMLRREDGINPPESR